MHAGKSVKEPLPYFNILFFKTIKSNKKTKREIQKPKAAAAHEIPLLSYC